MASIYDKQILSEKDLERIENLGKLWLETEDDKKRKEYHDAAEAVRYGYGYSGGDDGHAFNPIEQTVVNSALSSKDYMSELENAQKLREQGYEDMISRAQADADERLRQAYIKNMQQSLGLAQALKADGITGGATESTRAALEAGYLSLRDDILEDASDDKADIRKEAAWDKADYNAKIAKAGYDAAIDRADRMSESEQKKYDRAQDEYNKNYQAKKDEQDRLWQEKMFEYQKQLDTYDREYQKQLDTYDREYQKQQDALDRQAALKKSSSSGGSGSSSAEKAEKERIETLKKEAWKLLEKGVYDESFPALLGYSKEVLLEYMNNSMAGF